MNVATLRKFCLGQPWATQRLYEAPYNVLVYAVGGKTFAYFKTSEPERLRFSVRVTPDRFLELTDQPGIKPARYRGRYHWVTIVRVEGMPAGYLRELVRSSHQRALDSLSRKARAALAVQGV